jgi:hypothetical protein
MGEENTFAKGNLVSIVANGVEHGLEQRLLGGAECLRGVVETIETGHVSRSCV